MCRVVAIPGKERSVLKLKVRNGLLEVNRRQRNHVTRLVGSPVSFRFKILCILFYMAHKLFPSILPGPLLPPAPNAPKEKEEGHKKLLCCTTNQRLRPKLNHCTLLRQKQQTKMCKRAHEFPMVTILFVTRFIVSLPTAQLP